MANWLRADVLGLFAFGLAFGGIGLALCVGAVKTVLGSIRFARTAQRVYGEVTSIETNGRTYRPVIRYYAEGQERVHRSSVWSSRQPQVGQTIEVSYDPAKPDDARTGNDAGCMAAALLLIGVPFLMGGVFAFMAGLNRPAAHAKEQKAVDFVRAAERGDLAVVRASLDADPQLVNAAEHWETKGSTSDSIKDLPLAAAARNGHVEVVDLLLARGADANATDSDGYTALHRAGHDIPGGDKTGQERRLAIMQSLLDHHARINAKNRDGSTPLHTNTADSAIVAFLIQHGADPSARDRSGETPLMVTSNASSMEAMLAAGAPVNAQNDEGATALHGVAYLPQSMRSALNAMALLCSCGARTDLRNQKGQTPLDIARKRLEGETDPEWRKTRSAVVKFLSPGGGCRQLQDRARESHQPTKQERAFFAAQTACDEGDVDGCGSLAYAYSEGDGVPLNPARAVELYTKTCDQGSLWACGNLGVHYDNGEGIAEDAARAATLYRKACDGGEAFACVNLGTLYENGRGVPEDKARALALYHQGCQGGEDRGCRKEKKLR